MPNRCVLYTTMVFYIHTLCSTGFICIETSLYLLSPFTFLLSFSSFRLLHLLSHLKISLTTTTTFPCFPPFAPVSKLSVRFTFQEPCSKRSVGNVTCVQRILRSVTKKGEQVGGKVKKYAKGRRKVKCIDSMRTGNHHLSTKYLILITLLIFFSFSLSSTQRP